MSTRKTQTTHVTLLDHFEQTHLPSYGSRNVCTATVRLTYAQIGPHRQYADSARTICLSSRESLIMSARRILLVGPPAAGKSAVARCLVAMFPKCAYLNLDEDIRSVSNEVGNPKRLTDHHIDEATRRFLSKAMSKEFVVAELPHHDYVSLVNSSTLVLDQFVCIAVLSADYEVLKQREIARSHDVPIDYIARCVGGTAALLCTLGERSSPWLAFDTRFMKPEAIAQCISDFVRRDESANLAKLQIVPRPALGYLGGHFKHDVEWDETLVRSLLQRSEIRTALDVGCGNGGAIRRFAELGVDAWGLDGYLSDSSERHRIVVVDLTKQWIEWPMKPDLIWCVEVLEHIPQLHEESAIRTIARNAGKLAFVTAAPPGQPGYHHVNCQPKEYWIERFEDAGLKYATDCQAMLNELSDEGPFGMNIFKRNGLLFEVAK